MKKILCLVLVLVLGLSLCACGAGEPDLAGTWKNADDSYYQYTLVLNADHTGTLKQGEDDAESFTWVYDIPSCTLVTIEENGDETMLTYVEAIETLYAMGAVFKRAE